MSDREVVFRAIRKALAPLEESARASYPDWKDELAVSRAHPEFADDWELFRWRMESVHGIAVKGLDAVAEILRREELQHGYCDPELLAELSGRPAFAGIALETTFDRSRYDDFQFGITLAAGAVAETGSILLSDRVSGSRLSALSPWAHIAVLRPDGLYPDLPAALKSLGNDPSIVMATGPSKTADVEGILIEGVHGPGIQVCCLWDGGEPQASG